MPDLGERPAVADVATPADDPSARTTLEPLVLAARVRLLYARAAIAQITVVVNACLVVWVFRDVTPRARSIAWAGALCAMAAVRMALAREYRRRNRGPLDAKAWARRFTLAASLTGVGWGAAALLFYPPRSPVHQVFLAFVLGGMTAGAASSNASYTPAVVAFTAPAVLPMIVRLGAEREPIHAAMAFMLSLFAVAVGAISRSGSRTIEEAIRLRFRNEALVEIREVLREADRRKNQFIAVLSHELRNPLAPIRNSLYILRRAAPGGEQARRALDVIERQVQHTTRLVDDLLDVTRITRDKVRLQRERVELGELARRAAEDHRESFARSGVRLDVEVGGDPVVVDADPTRIAQMIGNVLQNAVKFTPRGGSTTLAIGRTDRFGTITVRDTGVGIAADVLPRLFEPFVQVESTLDRTTGGLGLGLALVKGLAELHGGTATAHSEGVGKGATFTVRLPLERRNAPRLTLAPRVPARAAAHRVLLIEDNVDAAETLKESLELNGHVVDVALTGPEGLEKARALDPDVVLCDIGLPGMDGFQVAKAIRLDPKVGAVGLIAVSGYAQPEDVERCREAGFDLHLAKPPDLDALERAIGHVRERALPGTSAAMPSRKPSGA